MKTSSRLAMALAATASFAWLCSSATVFTGCCRDGVRTETRTLTKEEWIGSLGGTFGDLTLRLNNYTPNFGEFREEAELAFFKPNDSFLAIGSLGISFPFDIQVQRSDPYSLYVNDINSTRVVPDARGGKAVITIEFEDNDTEVVGNCVDNFFCFCGDPAVNLDDLKIDILLTLGAAGGRVVIRDVDARMRSTFEESGPCVDNACAFACDLLAPDRESTARSSIEGRVVEFFNMNRGLVEGLLNNHLRSLGVTETITSAIVGQNGDLSLIVQYPDTCE